jgi:hypothetical protein
MSAVGGPDAAGSADRDETISFVLSAARGRNFMAKAAVNSSSRLSNPNRSILPDFSGDRTDYSGFSRV